MRYIIKNSFGSEVDEVAAKSELDALCQYATKRDLAPSQVLRLGYSAERVDAVQER